MDDGIIKGNGTSRYLKSIATFLTQYPTYEAFAQALIEGTLPIDLYGLNPDGWELQGTPLNKANLLDDSTAASYGLSGTATPNTAFAQVPTAKMMSRMINASSALDRTTLAENDCVAINDVSADTGKKITVSDLTKYLKTRGNVGESTFQKLITGRLI